MEPMGWFKQQEAIKRFTQGLNLKRNLLNGALLHVCAFVSVVPYPGRVSRERCLWKKGKLIGEYNVSMRWIVKV